MRVNERETFFPHSNWVFYPFHLSLLKKLFHCFLVITFVAVEKYKVSLVVWAFFFKVNCLFRWFDFVFLCLWWSAVPYDMSRYGFIFIYSSWSLFENSCLSLNLILICHSVLFWLLFSWSIFFHFHFQPICIFGFKGILLWFSYSRIMFFFKYNLFW